MKSKILHNLIGRLSLRAPQAESLTSLAKTIELSPDVLQQERDLTAILETLKMEFSMLEDFERDFPSLCFALATGVGKTRLMGAFISYLHLAHGINHFFVLAPNLTIYNKLIADFTPNTPKYVFKGISEFAINPPKVITGDDYETKGRALDIFGSISINIFNIAKITSEVRGGKSPKIKRLSEYLGDSYFNYLAELPDLVLLMDESHRYRAQAGMRAINELKPLLGLELTATPFVETSRAPIPFKNVVVDYPLARAMEDGFVKEPAVVTQRGFDAKAYSPEELEKIKLEDGVRLHETTKVELLTYSRENNVKLVKPFMLVIARDTTHAAQLLTLIESDQFHDGRYRGKVIQVDSSKSGAEEEIMISKLLAVESVDEPTEIVIHVNMLKEGWDVTNLYTIVPLRAANARTLIEQSIGRGLRLPYGKRTGIDAVDRLNIVAHDKFQEIIDEANRGDSPIRLKQVILEKPNEQEHKISVYVESNIYTQLGIVKNPESTTEKPPLFVSESELLAAKTTLDVIRSFETQCDFVPTSGALLNAEVQKEILAEVTERLRPNQASVFTEEKIDLTAVVSKTVELVVQQTIDIPRITVVPTGEITTGFHPFKLDISKLHLQPREHEIVGQNLRTNKQFTLAAETGLKQARLEDYLVLALVDFEDVDYFTQSELLYDLAGQMVEHLRSYLSEVDAENVLHHDNRLIAKEIHAQMVAHFWEQATDYEVKISRGFTELKPCNYTATEQKPRYFRETLVDKVNIKKMIFNGFQKCLYPLQKFDSDTERRFVIILERDALKWFKPVKGQFQIYYKSGSNQPEYIPDFIAETDTSIFMVETKAQNDIDTQEVQAKAIAAKTWCQNASVHAKKMTTKSWKYLLLPHNKVSESMRLVDFLHFESRD